MKSNNRYHLIENELTNKLGIVLDANKTTLIENISYSMLNLLFGGLFWIHRESNEMRASRVKSFNGCRILSYSIQNMSIEMWTCLFVGLWIVPPKNVCMCIRHNALAHVNCISGMSSRDNWTFMWQLFVGSIETLICQSERCLKCNHALYVNFKLCFESFVSC